MEFSNSYEDDIRAEAYSKLEFHNTYYLAFRDLPIIFSQYVQGNKAIDFGCGTGRSTRFLQENGFETIGIDISKQMVTIAKETDPKGDYRVIEDGDYSSLKPQSYDLILSAFTFDNIQMEKKKTLFSGLTQLLKTDGIFINLVCSPEMYFYEWASFSTKDYQENKYAKTGDVVRIITTDFDDKRPCYDIICPEYAYREIYESTNLQVIKLFKPLAVGNEPYPWINETTIAPWHIYVLKKKL